MTRDWTRSILVKAEVLFIGGSWRNTKWQPIKTWYTVPTFSHDTTWNTVYVCSLSMLLPKCRWVVTHTCRSTRTCTRQLSYSRDWNRSMPTTNAACTLTVLLSFLNFYNKRSTTSLEMCSAVFPSQSMWIDNPKFSAACGISKTWQMWR